MTCRRLLFGLVAALPLLLGGGKATAQAPPPDVVGAPVQDGDYYIVANNASQDAFDFMCLDVPNGDTRPNIFIQLYPIRPNQENQLWRLQRQSDGFYQITNVNSRMALDVPDGSRSPGAHLQRSYPNNGDNQRWRLDLSLANGCYRIVSKNSLLNLDVPSGDFSVHQYVQQFTPNSGWNQTWLLIPR